MTHLPGILDDGKRDETNFDHWFVTPERNRESIEKAAWKAAKTKRQMIHNHIYQEDCDPFTKCYTIEIEVEYIGKS